eukprot:COSAG02_NODE_144_length_34086_cov_65.390944_21_plen_128_part_00
MREHKLCQTTQPSPSASPLALPPVLIQSCALCVCYVNVWLQRAYVGGLQVCKHMWSLLDSDQENDPRVQKWKDMPLTYYQKYRFYFQEYVPDHHIVSVPRQGWGIAAAGGNAEVSNSASLLRALLQK